MRTPALAGDDAAKARRDEVAEKRRAVCERIDALRVAVESGEAHLERQAEAKAEAERAAAADQEDELHAQQRAAAERIDAVGMLDLSMTCPDIPARALHVAMLR